MESLGTGARGGGGLEGYGLANGGLEGRMAGVEAKTAYMLCLSSDACEPAARRLASLGDRSGNPCSRSACSTPWG